MKPPVIHVDRPIVIKSARVLDTAGASAILHLVTDEGERRAFLRFAGRKTFAKAMADTAPEHLLAKAKGAVVDGATIDRIGQVRYGVISDAVMTALEMAIEGKWPSDNVVPANFAEMNANLRHLPFDHRHAELVQVKRGHEVLGVYDRSGMTWKSTLAALACQGDLGPEVQEDPDSAENLFRVVALGQDYVGPVTGVARHRLAGTIPTEEVTRAKHDRLLSVLSYAPELHPVSEFQVEAISQLKSLEDEYLRRRSDGSLKASPRQVAYANRIAEALAIDPTFDEQTPAFEASGFIATHRGIHKLIGCSDSAIFAVAIQRAREVSEFPEFMDARLSVKKLSKACGNVRAAMQGLTEVSPDRVEYADRFEDELDRLERAGVNPALMRSGFSPAEFQVWQATKAPLPETRWVAEFAGMPVEEWLAKVADAINDHPGRTSRQRTLLRQSVTRDLLLDIIAERKLANDIEPISPK